MLRKRVPLYRLAAALLLSALAVLMGMTPSRAVTDNLRQTPPTITSLSQTSAVAGSAGFTLTVNGTNFVSTSQVYFGFANLTTTYVSATQLTAAVPTADLANPAVVAVVASNGRGSGGFSNPVLFRITPVNAPTITSLSPTSAVAGSAAFTLTVTGTNFVSGSQVFFGNTPLATTYGSATSLTASVPAALVARVGTANVVVNNGRANGGASNAVSFTITPASPAPTISSLSPTSVVAGSGAFTLTVNGANFLSGSQVTFDGIPLTTTFVSAAQLTAAVPADAVAFPGTANVVVNNGPTSGRSSPSTFTISPPTAQVFYLVGRHATNSALAVEYQASPGAALDLTTNDTVSLTVTIPATAGASAVTVYQTGDLTLTPVTYSTRGGSSQTIYRASTPTALLTVVPQANNQYAVQLEAIDVDLSGIDRTQPVSVTLDLGGQTFTATAQPITD